MIDGTILARDAAAEAEMDALQELIVTVRSLRKDLSVPEKEAAEIAVYSTGVVATLAAANAALLRLARVSGVTVASTPLSGANARSTAGFDVAVQYERKVDVAAETERLTKEIAKLEKNLSAAERQLGNEAFIAKAPAAVVEGLKKQQAENRLLLDKAQTALKALGA